MSKKSLTQYLREIGSKGGKATSEAKAAAARKNGKRGGRPRKRPRDGQGEEK